MSKKEILLARQPIYDTQLRIYAYELLFRASQGSKTLLHDGDSATSLVMLNAFTEIGIQNLVADNKVFINFTRNLILNPPPIKHKNLVIEVLEDIAPDPDIVKSLEALRQIGYEIALDDFIYKDNLEPLIKQADIIKVDVLALTDEQLEQDIAVLKTHPVRLLAEKVESQEMYNRCKALGFDYFQGYFLSKPDIVKGKVTPANKLVVLQLLASLQNPLTSNPDELHRILSQDPSLSFKLLRLINSAALRRPQKIDSLFRAIILIGVPNIKRWASLLALSSLNDKPSALNDQALLRAKMCELLGETLNLEQPDLLFTLGMFSLLDAFFDRPLKDLLASISLSDHLNDALLERKGALGILLDHVIIYEEGRWGDINWQALEQLGLSIADVKAAYLTSLEWIDAADRKSVV